MISKRCVMRRSSLYACLLILLSMVMACPQQVDAQDAGAKSMQPLIEVLPGLNKTRGSYFLFSRVPLATTMASVPVLSPAASIEKIRHRALKSTGLRYKKVDGRTFVILD